MMRKDRKGIYSYRSDRDNTTNYRQHERRNLASIKGGILPSKIINKELAL